MHDFIRIFRLIAALWLFAAPVSAGPDRVSLMLGSVHINGTQQFEEFNPGVFLEWESDTYNRLSYSVGALNNSFGRVTVAAGVNVNFFKKNRFQADLFAGAAHYPRDGETFQISVGDVLPVAGLRLQYRSLYVLALPNDGIMADAILAYGLTIPLE